MPLRLRFGTRELSARWPWLLLTLAGMALFTVLGLWQWGRAADKRRLEQAFAAASQTAAAPLGERAAGDRPRYTRVEAQGRYEPARQFLLDNLSRDGIAGYEVLTPFRLIDGRLLLVNRGWLRLIGGGRARLPEIEFDPAPIRHVAGRLDELPVTGLESGRAPPLTNGPWPRLTSFPHFAELAAALGEPVETRQLLLDAEEPAGFRRDWRPASNGFSPERHLAYAIQWWSLAALALVLFIVVNLKRVPHEFK